MILAIGGGSSMDTAKGIGIIVENPEFEDVVSLEGVADAKKHAAFTIAVPATADTAAEVTIGYLVADPDKVRKFVCVDVSDIPDVAIADPDMMASMPAGLTAATGMDALTHAIEGYTAKGAWELSDMFHLKAIELISKNLRHSVKEAKAGKPDSRREGMALGQYIAGMGFLTLVWELITLWLLRFRLTTIRPMGLPVRCFYLSPWEFNKPVAAKRLADVAVAMGVDTEEMDTESAADAAIEAVR